MPIIIVIIILLLLLKNPSEYLPDLPKQDFELHGFFFMAKKSP
jgi:hypothetical protein